MKRIQFCFSIIIIFLHGIFCNAQSPGIIYTFSQPAGSLVYNSSSPGAVTIISGGADDTLSSFPAPATWSGFYFGGKWFSSGSIITVSSNGWLSFSPQANSYPVNSLASTSMIIAPLWDDLKIHTSGSVSYKVTGVVGARALVIEWQGILWNKNATDTALSFQAIIYDNAQSNITLNSMIEFRYKRNGTDSANVNNGSCSIGLSGLCTNDIFAFTDNTGMPDKTLPENSSIALKPSDTVRHRFKPSIQLNDECVDAVIIPFDITIPQVSVSGTTLQSTQSAGVPACGQNTNFNDVWYTFTKPNGITNFEIFTDSIDCRGILFKQGIEIYTSCGNALMCDYGSSGPGNTNAGSYLNVINQTCSSQNYLVRVFSSDTSTAGYFRLNLRMPGYSCAFANDISSCSLPFTASCSYCGFGNEYDTTNTFPVTTYLNGDDYVFRYEPSATQCYDFILSNTYQYSRPAMFVYDGCPDNGVYLTSILGYGSDSLVISGITLQQGHTYYIVIDHDPLFDPGCLGNFDFIAKLSSFGNSANDDCVQAVILPVSFSQTCTGSIDYSNACTTPTPAGIVPTPACGTFTDGNTADVWFTFTSSSTNIHQIKVDTTSNSAEDLAMAVYTGVCGALTLVNCDDNSNGVMPSLPVLPPSAGITYYIRIWSNNGTRPGNFRICVVEGCTAINDICIGAIQLTVGQYMPGDNSCASGINESMGTPTCWSIDSPVQVNTVWYRFNATSPSMKIQVHLLTLDDSQIALYSSSGGCGGNLTELFCNNNFGSCNDHVSLHSQINATGLLTGSTYYIRVDGVGSNTGTFEIIVLPNASQLPPSQFQDCQLAIRVCDNSPITVAAHQYIGEGNYCDLPYGGGNTCMVGGEVNSVLYNFNVIGSGIGNFCQFKITPDGIGKCDFMLWCIDTINGSGDGAPAVPNYCNTLMNFTNFPATVCNYSFEEITGCSISAGSLNIPGFYMGTIGAPGLVPAIFIPGGMTAKFLLIVNRDSLATGFTIDWLGTPISCDGASTIWQGTSNSFWNDTANWNSGIIPDCNNRISTIISTAPNMPIITSNTNAYDITINAGASLTINSGITLNVCGNFINNGQLICNPGSTLKFIDSTNTFIGGSYNQSFNNFRNLEIAKTAGAQVSLSTDIYIMENDSVYSGIFNSNSYDILLKGNFYNYNGSQSFLFNQFSKLIFGIQSISPQHFRNDGSSLSLGNVQVNQIAGGSLLLDSNSNSDLAISNSLNLTSGIIKTGSQRKVIITNDQSIACNAGSTISYVEGILTRAIGLTAATYDFPVGNASKGYQRFSIQYFNAPSVPYNLTAEFKPWISMPPSGPSLIECTNSGWDIYPPFDNGYWNLQPSDTTSLGEYTANAYSKNISNNIGATFSIMKSESNNGLGPWQMEGNAVCWSTASHTLRDSLTSFSDFAVVQSTPLDFIHEAQKNEFSFSIFPNPGSAVITVAFTYDASKKFTLFIKDITGRIVLNKNIIAVRGTNTNNINIDDLAKGVYMICLENENQKALRKLIVE
jgi:hypothetical protein